jgi:hypothetical protein
MKRVAVNGPAFMAGFQCYNTSFDLHKVYQLVFILELRWKASPFGLKADHKKQDMA